MSKPGPRTRDLPHAAAAWPALLVLLAAGCAGTPAPRPPADERPPFASGERDGAEVHPPADLELVPDAVPRIEPIRVGGPNKPYEAEGRSYVPLTDDVALRETGLASWYGRKYNGRPTAIGETYDMYAMTAAHPTMPLPSYARVRNPANGREVIVRVNDRGPFRDGRVIDLSYTAALKLGVLRAVAPVEVERITFDEIRSGAWRADGGSPAATPAAPMIAAPLPADADPIAEFARRVNPPPAPQAGPGAAGVWWVQLGAFRDRDGAAALRRKIERDVDWAAPLLAIVDDPSLHRLQAGPYASRGDAGAAAERLGRMLQLTPLVVERR